MDRLTFLIRSMSGFAAGAAMTSSTAVADDFPSRPITLIVPWGPGGGADQMGRAVAAVMQESLKSATVPVVNVPGADGNDGIVKLVEGDADGYTIAVLVSDTFYGNMTSKTAPPWQLKDIVPLAVMNRQPLTFFAAKSGAYKSWKEIEAASKRTPVKIAIDGFGSAEDVLTKYLAAKGVKLVPIPYAKPGERYAALLGNQVDLMCEPDGNVRRYIAAGQIRPVIVFSSKRVPEIDDAPTAAELGHNIALAEWRSIVVKAGTDPEKIRFLSDALARVDKSSEYRKFLKDTWSDADSYVSYKDLPAYLRTKSQEMQNLLLASR